ncbi:MAG TPA: hypothetical protein VMW69_09145 [Spirochaetia bacterium]|nr:hypothetical protein [Spirochaetia bacterium]
MKRILLVLALLGGVSALSFSLEAGGGISVFVPESLYLNKQGSVSVETNFQYALGLSKFLSFPIGVSYNKIYGYRPGGDASLDAVTNPWFFGDSIMGYVMAKIHLPVSIFYLDLFGGGAGNWNVTLTPVGQNIESYLATQAGVGNVAISSLSYSAPVGYGWVAGAGFGVSIKKIRVDITGTYRDVRSPLTMTADYYKVDSSGATPIATKTSTPLSSAALVMRGFSVGVNGHFSF